VAFPATSVATTEMELDPGVRVTVQENAPPDRVAAVPLQVTDETPDTASVWFPEMPMEAVLSAMVEPLVGEAIERTGDVLSKLTVTDALVLFPAVSVAVPETTRFETSLLTVCAGVQL
jgi:hypothetical protein